tara:strand:- start:978 stop:1268 length:291 start_codon:yes stop_codon:yes gene_type:complete
MDNMREPPKSGEVYGKLTVKKRVPAPKSVASRTSKSYWLCECTCGKKLKVRSDRLLGGTKPNCGHKESEWSEELKGPDVAYSDRKQYHLDKKNEAE